MMTAKPKIILTCFNGDESETPFLRYVFGLGARYRAHIAVWYILPEPGMIISSYPAYDGPPAYPESVHEDMVHINEQKRATAERLCRDIARQGRFENYSFHTASGTAEEIMARQGRLSDLTIISRNIPSPQQAQDYHFTDLANGALFGSGRPVLLAPPLKHKNGQDQENNSALIGWNGSIEAARAVAFALPYLAHGPVWIISIPEASSRKNDIEAADLAAYLARHDIKAEIISDYEKTGSLPETILHSAAERDAGMIVMGAWGHSRLRQMIWGGVTSYMLSSATLPVFMAH